MNTYWDGNGKYQKTYEQLHKLIPATGEVEGKGNRALERLRKYVNAYYDLFNNGGCNRAQAISRYFPGALRFARDRRWDRAKTITEPKIDAVIVAAAVEQGFITDKQEV
jgi:hypothetical protein